MELSQALATRIIQLLNLNDWSGYKLSGQGAVPNSTISNILLGKCKSCNLLTLLNICRGFQIELTDFFDSDLLRLENLLDND